MSLNSYSQNLDATMSKSKKDSPCYFCNEMFEMGQLQAHLKLCGSILEQCPLRCGAWIQRKHKETHVKECPKMEKTRTSSSHVSVPAPAPPPPPAPVSNHTWSPKRDRLDDCVSYLEKEVASIKLALTEESGHRDVQTTEIETIRSKLVLVEERSQHFLSTLVSLRAAVDDEAERSANWAAQFKHDLANVQLALQKSIFAMAPKLYNKVPKYMTSVEGIDMFKKKLFLFLIDKAYYSIQEFLDDKI